MEVFLNYLFQSSIKSLKESLTSIINQFFYKEYRWFLERFLIEKTFSTNFNVQTAHLLLINDITKGKLNMYTVFLMSQNYKTSIWKGFVLTIKLNTTYNSQIIQLEYESFFKNFKSDLNHFKNSNEENINLFIKSINEIEICEYLSVYSKKLDKCVLSLINQNSDPELVAKVKHPLFKPFKFEIIWVNPDSN